MLICIVGRSGSGKTTLLENLIENSDNGFIHVKELTTRPRRNEYDNSLEFITDKECDFILCTNRTVTFVAKNGWRYLFKVFELETLSKDKNVIIVTNPSTARKLQKEIPDMITVNIKMSKMKLLTSSLKRTIKEQGLNKKNLKECFRRFRADNKDFSDMSFCDIEIENSVNRDINQVRDELLYKLSAQFRNNQLKKFIMVEENKKCQKKN